MTRYDDDMHTLGTSGSWPGSHSWQPSGSKCGLGASRGLLVALHRAIIWHGALASTSADEFSAFRLGHYVAISYPDGFRAIYAPGDGRCHQCVDCGVEGEAAVRRSASIVDTLGGEDAHILEDKLARLVLRAVVDKHPEADAMAVIVADLLSTPRTRWYA